MKDESAFFIRNKIDKEGLLRFGFIEKNGEYHYRTSLLGGQFSMEVRICEGSVFTKLSDTENDCEYVLHTVSGAQGEFVGSVRMAYEEVLSQIRDQCFLADVFKSDSARSVINYVSEKYGDTLEFLWKSTPDNAVCRRKDNQKWYAAILTVKRNRIGLDGDEKIEIIDLRISPDEVEQTIDFKQFFPGYHMNKKSWYTICLDGSVPDEEIFRRIDVSYRLAKKKSPGS